MGTAGGDGKNWNDALNAAFDRNDRGGAGPTSIRSLAKTLAEMSGGHPTQDSWISSLKLIRRDNRATEEKAQEIAAALGVSRRSLPPASERLTVGKLERRLRVVEERAVQVEDLAPVLTVLQLLANGKRAEALRALSEWEGP